MAKETLMKERESKTDIAYRLMLKRKKETVKRTVKKTITKNNAMKRIIINIKKICNFNTLPLKIKNRFLNNMHSPIPPFETKQS